jgi:hypothetical protein
MPEHTQKRFEAIAHNREELWRWITIDGKGNVKDSAGIMTQVELFHAIPEINPSFFRNFGVVELTIRQKSGIQVKIMRVR